MSAQETEMYTPERLLEIAENAEARYKTLLEQFPPGTVNTVRNEAHRQMEEALICAEWMLVKGIESAANVGPFETTQVRQAQQVRVRRGAQIFGTHPQMPREGIESKRAQVVTVHSVDSGHTNMWTGITGESKVCNGRIHWAGTGGYWRWTDINNVEILDETA